MLIVESSSKDIFAPVFPTGKKISAAFNGGRLVLAVAKEQVSMEMEVISNKIFFMWRVLVKIRGKINNLFLKQSIRKKTYSQFFTGCQDNSTGFPDLFRVHNKRGT